jgi:hypothetical protein
MLAVAQYDAADALQQHGMAAAKLLWLQLTEGNTALGVSSPA